jgi:hypothetical protein
MPNLRSSLKKISGAGEPETGEEHVKDLEFEVSSARYFHRPLIKVVGALIVAEAAMTAYDSVIQQQGVTPENALGVTGVVMGTVVVRGLSRMINGRAEAAALELQTLEAAAEAERISETPPGMDTEPVAQELAGAA